MRMLWPEGERFAAHRQLTRGQKIHRPPGVLAAVRGTGAPPAIARTHTSETAVTAPSAHSDSRNRLSSSYATAAPCRPAATPLTACAPCKGLAENEKDEVVLG